MKKNKMKINIVGNGCTWTKALSSSYIINNELMFDAPEGSFKTLYTKYNLLNINNIIISHLHNDHFLSLHLILHVFRDFAPNKHINIIASKDCKMRVLQLIDCVGENYLKNYIESNVNFINCENGKTIEIDDYKITPYLMLHNPIESYGYVVEKDNIKVGFSGDTAMCEGLEKILTQVNNIFIDCTAKDKNDKHLTCDEVLNLSKKFKNVKFYPMHLSNYAFKTINKKLKILKQGSSLTLNY